MNDQPIQHENGQTDDNVSSGTEADSRLNAAEEWRSPLVILVAGLLLAASAIRIAGILPKAVALVGVIIAVKSGFLFTSKASDQVFDTLIEKPLSFFRIGAFFILVVGLVMVFI